MNACTRVAPQKSSLKSAHSKYVDVDKTERKQVFHVGWRMKRKKQTDSTQSWSLKGWKKLTGIWILGDFFNLSSKNSRSATM